MLLIKIMNCYAASRENKIDYLLIFLIVLYSQYLDSLSR